MTFPTTIDTDRLQLRQFRHEDWTALHEHYGDLECTKFTFGRALTERESWRAMASMAGHWLLRGYGPYALVEKSSQAVVGAAGLWYPNDWPEPEIKWALVRRFWGQGLAAEAVRAIQPAAVAHFDGRAPISFMNAQNVASAKLALRVGAVLEAEVDFRGSPWRIYRHPGGRAPGLVTPTS